MEGIFFLVACLVAYLIPTWIAMIRNHRNDTAIFLTNLFLGWTFLGWVVALIWAFTADVRGKAKAPAAQ